jgi:hypothetical protein
MKKVGQLQISESVWLTQYDELNFPLKLKAPIKTAICDTPDNIWIKYGPKDTEWIKSTKSLMLVDIHSWFFDALDLNKSELRKAELMALKGIRTFDVGDVTDKGSRLVDDLQKNYLLQGLTPNIMYIPASEVTGMDDNAIYQHQFSQTTLLYKHKSLPILVLTNGNIDLGTSRLMKNKYGLNRDELLLNGITG